MLMSISPFLYKIYQFKKFLTNKHNLNTISIYNNVHKVRNERGLTNMDNEYKLGQENEENQESKEKQETTNGEVNFILQETSEEKVTESTQSNPAGQGTPIENAQAEEKKTASGHLKEESHIGEIYQMGGNTPQGNNVPPTQKRPKKKKGNKGFVKVAACVGFAVLFGIVASGTYQASNYIADRLLGKHRTTSGETTQVNTTKVNGSTKTVTSDVTAIVKEAMPSVVSITNMSVQEVQSFFGGTQMQKSQSSGSGIIIGKNDKELLIVTNNHVIENSTSLTVSFIDNESVEGIVKGTDASRDVAVVAVPLNKIKNDTLEEISIATVGDSSKLNVGEPAIAIGNALGYGQSVTTGIISATNRELEGFKGKLIQTDAAINPGNSGGALLNANGEVIGINTVKINAEAVEGIGYAIPLSDIKGLLENLMNKETRTKVSEAQRGYLGIAGLDVTEESAKMYNMTKGVFVSEVTKGGGAEKAGVIPGSIITGFEGIGVDTMQALQEQLQYYRVGEKVKLTLQVPADKGTYKEETVEITLGKRQ